MLREYGGYLPLELRKGRELFNQYNNAKIARFNSGRWAIVSAVLSVRPRTLYIPYFNCSVVRDALSAYKISYKQYFLDSNLEPSLDVIGSDDWILYVNYFGTTPKERIQKIAQKFKNVIFDNTQAFYATPLLDGKCMNVYSPRKFVGLADGGYLIWSGECKVNENYPQDISWDRAAFLFKSIELGTNAAYQDNLCSKVSLEDGIKRMSVLTQKMLQSVDYDFLAEKREKNFRVLFDQFFGINQLKLSMEGYAPFVYPLLVAIPNLREKIVSKKIYVPQWWKYLLTEVPDTSVEAWLSKWLLPLPIDQRYSERDMEEMSEIILSCINECKFTMKN